MTYKAPPEQPPSMAWFSIYEDSEFLERMLKGNKNYSEFKSWIVKDALADVTHMKEQLNKIEVQQRLLKGGKGK